VTLLLIYNEIISRILQQLANIRFKVKTETHKKSTLTEICQLIITAQECIEIHTNIHGAEGGPKKVCLVIFATTLSTAS